MFGIDGEPHPATLDILPVGFAKAGGRPDDPVFENAAGAVARLVQRIELGGGKARGLLEHGAGQLGGLAAQPAHGIEDEAHIGERGGVRHCGSPAGAAA